MHPNSPTADLVKSMTEVAETLHDSSSLLSAAVGLAEVGQDEEARCVVELTKKIQSAEGKMRTHIKNARVGKIAKLDVH